MFLSSEGRKNDNAAYISHVDQFYFTVDAIADIFVGIIGDDRCISAALSV
jgi:hypothetical protein